MHLGSSGFLAVFAAFFALYSAAPARLKRPLLVLGSLAFYATYSLPYVPLFLALGVFTFVIGGRLHRETSEVRRDRLLWIGVGVNLLALAGFKIGAAVTHVGAGALSAAFAIERSRLMDFVMQLGISFYTLQAMSYVIDVHRKVYEPPRPISFLASFTLFPHLLSGPIVRTSFLAPLIERVQTVKWQAARRALLLFSVGLLKKAVADRLAPTADGAFDVTRAISPLEAWTGLVAYAGQLYGDFSGYTDMATATAMLLGLDLPPNFDLPYLATSPADFWRRWHISLSSWLRDYVYLPLGVRFRRRRYTNIVATWIFAGLWHGITLPFLLYGAYHGVLLAATDWLSRRFGGEEAPRGYRRVAQTALTLYLVLIGYVLFRAHSLSAAGHLLAALHWPVVPPDLSRKGVTTMGTCVLAVVFCHALDHVVRRWRELVERPWILWPAIVVAVTCVALFSGAAQPFIYFAF